MYRFMSEFTVHLFSIHILVNGDGSNRSWTLHRSRDANTYATGSVCARDSVVGNKFPCIIGKYVWRFGGFVRISIFMCTRKIVCIIYLSGFCSKSHADLQDRIFKMKLFQVVVMSDDDILLHLLTTSFRICFIYNNICKCEEQKIEWKKKTNKPKKYEK